MSKTSAGRKNLAVRLRTPAPRGTRTFKLPCWRSAAPSRRMNPQYTPEPLPIPAPGEACVHHSVTQRAIEPASASAPVAAHGAPEVPGPTEFLYYPVTHCYYIRCRDEGPVWTPDTTLSPSAGRLVEPPAAILYVKCQPDRPIWVPATRTVRVHGACSR